MLRRALLSVLVYAVFNFATLHGSSDPVQVKKLAELSKCLKDLTTSGGKDKICHNVKDFETMQGLFIKYYSMTHGNKSVNTNKEYLEIIIRAVSHNRSQTVEKNLEKCKNSSALNECEAKQYKVSEEIPLKKKLFSKNHNIIPKRSSCSDSRKINACILKNVITSCDNTTIEFFKDIMDNLQKKCSKVEEDSGSDGKGGASSYLQTTMSSITINFLIVLLL